MIECLQTMLEYAIKEWDAGGNAKFSSASQSWNYLYETDAAEIFFRLGQESVPSGTYIVANSESRKLRDYIEILMKEYGEGAKAEFAPVTSRSAHGLNVDTSKTIEAIRFSPMISFEEGIRKMIDAQTSKIRIGSIVSV